MSASIDPIGNFSLDDTLAARYIKTIGRTRDWYTERRGSFKHWKQIVDEVHAILRCGVSCCQFISFSLD